MEMYECGYIGQSPNAYTLPFYIAYDSSLWSYPNPKVFQIEIISRIYFLSEIQNVIISSVA